MGGMWEADRSTWQPSTPGKHNSWARDISSSPYKKRKRKKEVISVFTARCSDSIGYYHNTILMTHESDLPIGPILE